VGSIAPDEFAWALGALAALHRIPFDAPLLLKQFPPPTTLDTILLAARALGLEVHPQAAGRKHRIDLPALVLIGGGASSGATSDSLIARAEPTTTDEAGAAERVPEAEPADRAGARLALIVRLDGDQAHYFLHDEPTPRIAPLASLQARALAPFAYFSKPAAPRSPIPMRAPRPASRSASPGSCPNCSSTSACGAMC
jgi:hypothetical protein